jgi:LPS O-antigen subunit length determinant protein (WzzB/FepE family)
MRQNSRNIQDDEIDLSEIIKTLWNEKILILSISLIFMVIGYVYGSLQPKIYKTEIILREAPSSLFEAYRPFFSTQQQQGIAREFNDQVKLNLSSLDTLVQFAEETNTINDFKNYLKEKNISVKEYFQPELGTRKFEPVIDKKNNSPNKYSLTYSQPLPGPSFLNDYIIFNQQQTMTIFRQRLTQNIINEINIHEQHLEIAKKIGLENTILQSMVEVGSVVNEPSALFYKGSKMLTQQITYLNKSLNETKNLTLDYNPILEQASSPAFITKSPIIYAVIALLLGLFSSFLFIFFRNFLKE